MIRHLFIAALRNMAANKLQTVIAVLGLSVGIAAALLMALVIRNQLTFDHFIPGYKRTYLAVGRYPAPGRPDFYADATPLVTAAVLTLNVPEVEIATRLMLPQRNITGKTLVRLKQGPVAADETIYWADPNLFDVLPLPVFQGDPAKALRQPDGIVLPRAIARKYFGREDVVGQVIAVNGHPMMVRAVIEDLPANGTSLKSGIFASDLAPFSSLATENPRDSSPVVTYVRLKPGASLVAAGQRLPKLIGQVFGNRSPGNGLLLARMDSLPLLDVFRPGAKTKLLVFGVTGALILFIAAINFVNLLTARASRRAPDVGVRKVCGAARPALMLQFLGEAILMVFFATCIGVAVSEWLLPSTNAFLETGAELDYGQNILGTLLCGVVVLGLLAGAWPAFVLSSLRPSNVLKGVLPQTPGADLIRKALVILQFAILIGLVMASAVIYGQNRYATREGLRGDIDQMLVVRGGCKPAFRAELRKLPGVAGAFCSDIGLLEGTLEAPISYKGKKFDIYWGFLDQGIFTLYGMKPMAGSLPPASAAGDYDPNTPPGLVLNQAGVKRLGFASPQAALGQALQGNLGPAQPTRRLPIVAVVPDFSFQALTDQPILPVIYVSGRNPLGDEDDLVSIKLRGGQIPETLASIDGLWRATNPGLPIYRFFLSDHMQQLYLGMLREAQLFAAFSGIAVFLACLGLLGLSIATAERRTKEIGIRKAMGATSAEIVALLLWQFSQPVLWASLIAWPIAGWAMQRWLSGFAYHVDLQLWLFFAASVVALAIALLTVAGQAIVVARQKPVRALRYE